MLAALILLVFCVKARNGIVDLWRDKSILLVIAHPDDEVLFFGPTLVRGSKIANFHILCLTSGMTRLFEIFRRQRRHWLDTQKGVGTVS